MAIEIPDSENGADDAALLALLNDDAFVDADRFFEAELDELNDSDVEGHVLMALDEDTGRLTVVIDAEGLEPNQVHLQHIHGFLDGTDASIPDEDGQDTDGDGWLEVGEGAVTYGPVLLNLRLDHEDGSGGDNGHSHEGGFEGFPLAPDGTIRFVETFQLPVEDLPNPPDLELRHVVIHGMSADDSGAGTPGEVNGTAGYKLALPVTNGEIEEISVRKALNHFEDMIDDAFEDALAGLDDEFEDALELRFDVLRDQIDSATSQRFGAADWLAA